MKNKVSHSAIVELMYEAISNEKSLPSMTNATADDAVKVSPVVDTAAAGLSMDPVDMKPKNKSDAVWLIRQSMDEISDDQVEELYKQFVIAVEKIKNSPLQIEKKTVSNKNTVSEKKTSNTTSKMNKLNEDSLDQDSMDAMDDAESLERLKKLLELPVGSEVVIANKKWDRVNHSTWRSQLVDGSDSPDKWTKDELLELFTDVSDTDDDDFDMEPEEDDGDKVLWGMNKKKASEPKQDESTFAEIAAELGLTTFGASKAMDAALKKMKFLLELPKGEREELTLEALVDYIDFLQSSEELSDDDVTFLKAHPEELSGSDEFRDYLKKYLNREIRNSGGSDEDDSE